MAKSVNKETTEGQYSTEITKIGQFHEALNAAKGTYTSEISGSSAELASAMSSITAAWNGDSVEQKLEGLVNNGLKAGLDKIEADVTGGSYVSLTNTANQLKTDLSNCKDAKHTWEEAKKDYATAESSYDSTPSEPADKKASAKTRRDNAKAAMDNAERQLEQKLFPTNTHFNELASFVFGGASTANNAVGGGSTLGSQTGAPEKPEEFVPVDEVTVAGGDVSEVAAMASGLATPTEEKVDSQVTKEGDTDLDGTENYTEERHTEQKFETLSGKEAERVEDLTITGEVKPGQDGKDEKLVPEHGEGEAHYRTSDDKTYTGEITIDYTHEGAAFQKDEKIKSDETGEQVAEVGTHQVIEYADNLTGQDVNVTDRKIEEGDQVSETRNMTYKGDNNETTYEVSSQWRYKKPEEGKPISEGTYVAEDYGTTHTYTYERNAQGQLIETDSYHSDGTPIFGWGKGDHNDTRVVDETVYTLRVTKSDGTVTDTPILVDSQMGQAEVRRQYENARMDVGCRADYSTEGIHHLWLGDGSPVEVSGYGNDSDTYTFQLIPPSGN